MTRRRGDLPASVTTAWLAAAAVWLWAAVPAAAEVTTFQQGVRPTPEYAGCVDTFIVGHGWAHDQPAGRHRRPALTSVGLMRFDVGAIGKERAVARALLRLSFASIPSQKLTLLVRTLAREWDATATWYEHQYKDAKKTDENNWTRFGGDLDDTDFGRGEAGLVGQGVARGGPFGHVVEVDVTPVVAEWVAGKRPNHGFHIATARGGFSIASAEWPLPPCRPALLIEHHPKGQQPKAGATLELPPAPGPEAKLSALAATADLDKPPEKWTVVRFGRNSNCHVRTGHMCGYAKQGPRYGGNWGWTPRLRVGGTAGDLNHAVFYFDLSRITQMHGDAARLEVEAPPGAEAVLGFDLPGAAGSRDRLAFGGLSAVPIVRVKRATLRVFADVGNVRLPKDTMGQAPQKEDPQQKQRRLARSRGRMGQLRPYSFGMFRILGEGQGPGWTEAGFDFRRAAPGKPWKGGTLVSATEPHPVAVCHVGPQWQKIAGARDEAPESWLEFDVTGWARALVQWKAANHGLVLDGRLMGGAVTLFSDDWIEPDRRPYLELEIFPAPDGQGAGPARPEPLLPEGDYWVKPMTKARATYKGTRGTVAQYGDSISITRAFWTPLLYGQRKGITPQMQRALDTAREYVHKPCWRDWKGPAWGNNGNMTIAWAFENIDAWQKKMNPEVAVILFGTNDAGYGPHPPVYTEMYAAVIDRMLADGTVPIITTLPPRGSQVNSVPGLLTVLDLRQAAIAVAKQKKVPLIDFYTETVRRRPKQWRKLLIPDGLHPSYPGEYQQDWTEEGLKHSAYTLRNYLTLRTWYDIYQKVLKE